MKGSMLTEELFTAPAEASDYREAWRTVFPDQKVRREPRFPFCFQIQVRGLDRNMNLFEEHTNTADISKSGCRFSLQAAVARGAFLAISVRGDDGRLQPENALYSVVWCRAVGGGYEVGAELADGPNLWNISFPELGVGPW